MPCGAEVLSTKHSVRLRSPLNHFIHFWEAIWDSCCFHLCTLGLLSWTLNITVLVGGDQQLQLFKQSSSSRVYLSVVRCTFWSITIQLLWHGCQKCIHAHLWWFLSLSKKVCVLNWIINKECKVIINFKCRKLVVSICSWLILLVSGHNEMWPIIADMNQLWNTSEDVCVFLSVRWQQSFWGFITFKTTATAATHWGNSHFHSQHWLAAVSLCLLLCKLCVSQIN